jgi:hypothetical protein
MCQNRIRRNPTPTTRCHLTTCCHVHGIKMVDFFNFIHPDNGIRVRVNFTSLSKVGRTLIKDASLRVNLDLDGAPVESKSHTHPS